MGRFCYLAGIVGLSCSFLQTGMARGNEAKWAGTGRYRILVKVNRVNIADRRNDEMVALCDIDFRKRIPSLPKNQIVDLHTVQVIKYSPTSGEPETYAMNHYQHSPYDRPWRFYDHSLLDDFPTFRGYISLDSLRGRPLFRTTNLPFGHRYFNPIGDGRRGKIVWAHTQEGDAPSHYGIYFDLLPPGTAPSVPPAGFIGDGSNRIVKQGPQCGPPANYRGCVVDWDGDGRSDILYATMSGYLVLHLNTGTPEVPEFKIRRLLYDTDGKPIDVGFCSCAHVTDWNNDGTRDLLVGAGKGCVLYYRNEGTDKAPQFSFSRFVETDGQMLVTPNWPIAELAGKQPGEVFKQDYVAMPCAVDWDGDGDRDLLAGGWITGMVFYHENVGSNDDGTPILAARGPLEADGKPLDTTWGAAPVAVDLDDDGDLDLLCGAKPMTANGGDFNDPDRILYYFENVGTRRKPRLEHRPFPMTGQSPTGSTVMASVVDWNHDGLLDLVLITHGSREAYFIKNIGSRQKPLFDMNVGPILGHWNGESLPRGRFVDWNKDGHPDIGRCE